MGGGYVCRWACWGVGVGVGVGLILYMWSRKVGFGWGWGFRFRMYCCGDGSERIWGIGWGFVWLCGCLWSMEEGGSCRNKDTFRRGGVIVILTITSALLRTVK